MGLEQRINYVFFIFCAVAPVSILGSSLTLRAIYYQYKGKRKLTTYQRLLMGISVFDVIFSLPLAFGPLPMPAELRDFGIPGAHGTIQSCAAQGFFTQLGYASFIYSHQLMFYFVLVIRYNITDATMERRVEPILHAVPILYGVITSILGLPLQVYNPSGVSCWIAAVPIDCELSDDVECTRGEHVKFFGNWLVVIPYVVSISLLIFWTLVIAGTVYQRHRATFSRSFHPQGGSLGSSRHQLQLQQPTGSTTATTSTPIVTSSRTGRVPGRSSSMGANNASTMAGAAKLRQAIVQSLLYGFWFLNFSIWSLMGNCFYLAGTPRDSLGKHFWMTAITLTLFPLQGLFNFVIYIRPTYLSIRQAYPQQGRWFAVKEAVLRPFATASERASASTSRKKSSDDNFSGGSNNIMIGSARNEGQTPACLLEEAIAMEGKDEDCDIITSHRGNDDHTRKEDLDYEAFDTSAISMDDKLPPEQQQSKSHEHDTEKEKQENTPSACNGESLRMNRDYLDVGDNDNEENDPF